MPDCDWTALDFDCALNTSTDTHATLAFSNPTARPNSACPRFIAQKSDAHKSALPGELARATVWRLLWGCSGAET